MVPSTQGLPRQTGRLTQVEQSGDDLISRRQHGCHDHDHLGVISGRKEVHRIDQNHPLCVCVCVCVESWGGGGGGVCVCVCDWYLPAGASLDGQGD